MNFRKTDGDDFDESKIREAQAEVSLKWTCTRTHLALCISTYSYVQVHEMISGVLLLAWERWSNDLCSAHCIHDAYMERDCFVYLGPLELNYLYHKKRRITSLIARDIANSFRTQIRHCS